MVVKNQDLTKKQEAKRLLNNIGLNKTPLSKIPTIGDVLF